MILEVHCMPADITRATIWNGGVPQGTTWKELILRGQLLGVSQTISITMLMLGASLPTTPEGLQSQAGIFGEA